MTRSTYAFAWARVAQAAGGEVAHALGHPARGEPVPPREERDEERNASKRASDDERRNREKDAEEHLPPALLGAGLDLEVDPVRAGSSDEAGEAPPDEIHEREEVRLVADIRGEEAVQPGRHPARHERGEPGGDRREDDRDRPQEEPDKVGDRQEQAEEHRQARPREVVVDRHADGVLGKLRVLLGERRVGARVARREQEEVPGRLGAVAERERDEVAETARSAPTGEDREPGDECCGCARAANGREGPPGRVVVPARRAPRRPLALGAAREPRPEHSRERESREGQDQPEEPAPTALSHRRVDLQVDRVVLLTAKPRVRVGGEEDVRAHLGGVPDVRRDEAVQAVGHLALNEDGEPVRECREEGTDPVQRHPDQDGDRQEEAEEDGETSALEVVGDLQPDRPLSADPVHAPIVTAQLVGVTGRSAGRLLPRSS